jgi:molybdopterin molybdotransferase
LLVFWTEVCVISVEQHLARIKGTVTALPTEVVPLAHALGRTLRADVRARVTLPPWPNSAMDGYAVRAEDLRTASANAPLQMPVVADIEAGSTHKFVLKPGTVARIMTGAPLPAGCDAVVALERVQGWDPSASTVSVAAPSSVVFLEPTSEGKNVRQAGEDAVEGSLILETGTQLTPPRLAACAAVGVSELEVGRRVRVSIIATGTELVEPGADLQWGQIFDSNGTLVRSLSEEAGAEIVSVFRSADDGPSLFDLVATASALCDVLIVTGGASVGAYDTTRLILDQSYQGSDQGVASDFRRIAFESVAMQPGKPQGFGQLDSGTTVWCLPGNPVSVWVSFQLFIEPALRALQGQSSADATWLRASASQSWDSPQGREQFMPVVVSSVPGEKLSVAPASARGSGSHLAASLGLASAMARINADVTRVNVGDIVLVKGMY